MNDNLYSQFLLLEFIVLDTNNARHLWKRIPQALKDPKKDETQRLRDIWLIGKALTKKNYGEAFKLLGGDTQGYNDTQKRLIEVLTKVLREEHVLKKVQKAYSSIPYDELKQMLGLHSSADDYVKSFLEKKGFKVAGKFAYPPVEDTDRKKFELTEDRIDHLSKVVQFLEQQKHDLSLVTQ